MALFVIGKESMEKGMNILGAHIDSPRLDLKQDPLYEDTDFAMLDTHYYGGIKKYQWVTLPLALHGVIAKKDGTVVKVNVGDKPGDPVFGVSFYEKRTFCVFRCCHVSERSYRRQNLRIGRPDRSVFKQQQT